MNENEAKALFRQAADIYKDGDHKDALKIFDRLDAAFPNNVRIMYPRARCFAKLGRTDEAVALCNTLIKQYGHQSAAQLKAQLQPGGGEDASLALQFEDTAFDPLDITIDDNLASVFDRPRVATPSRQMPSPKVIGAVILIGACVLVAVYALLGGKDDLESSGIEPPPAQMPSGTDATESNVESANEIPESTGLGDGPSTEAP